MVPRLPARIAVVGSLGLLVAWAVGAVCCAEEPTGYLVGVNYFCGWWEPPPNKWQGPDGQDWRDRYPERLPLLGQYNDQATMDREIVAAAEHGVNFFQILWYGADPGARLGPHAERLNLAVDQFMQSPHAPRLKFVIEYCNHRPFGISNDARWAECVAIWVRCMQHPSYLRVGGRPVFKVHGSGVFLEQCGNDPAGVQRRLDGLRGAARQAGLGELLIGCGAVGPQRIPAGHWIVPLFDFTNEYMAIPPLPASADDYPYAQLVAFHARWRGDHGEDAIPSVPCLPAGWNPRPWGDPRPAFQLPSRAEWTAALHGIRKDLDAGRLGFPLPDGRRQPALTIYCWNEYGEGGIVAPTRGDQYLKLEAIRSVFGAGSQESASQE